MNYQTDSVSIDLSKAVSRAPEANTVKIWLAPEGSSSFFNLGDEAVQSLSPNADGSYTVTLTRIPVGPTYNIYLSVGTKSDAGVFTINETANGRISVTGGSTTGVSLAGDDPAALAYTDLAGTPLKGVVEVNDVLYTTDGAKLYYADGSTLTVDFTEASASGYTFNSITEGIYGAGADSTPYLSANAADGRALFPWSDGFQTGFAAGLPNAITPPVNILSTDIFTSNDVQIGISQIDAGLIISFYDTGTVDPVEWIPVDLGPFLEDAGISLTGKLIRGLTVIVDDTAETGMIYMASKAGNFRKSIDWSENAENSGDTDEDLGDVFPVETSPLYAERILNIDSPDGEILFLGTSNGLWSAGVTAATSAIENETPRAAAGKRIEILKSGVNYTACVTALELIVVDNADYTVKTVSFNEGLPVSGKLTGDTGVTGLEWDGDTLYVSGNYGLAKVNAADLFAE
jgi:hypothetical protein